MVNHAAAIMARFPDAVPSRDFIVSSVDGVQTVDRWEAAAIGHPAPTAEDLAEWALLVRPPAEWLGFAAALNHNPHILGLAALAQSNPAALVLLLNLGVGLGQAAKDDPATFLSAWQGAIGAGVAGPEMIASVTALGQQFNLPADFLAALNPGGEP